MNALRYCVLVALVSVSMVKADDWKQLLIEKLQAARAQHEILLAKYEELKQMPSEEPRRLSEVVVTQTELTMCPPGQPEQLCSELVASTSLVGSTVEASDLAITANDGSVHIDARDGFHINGDFEVDGLVLGGLDVSSMSIDPHSFSCTGSYTLNIGALGSVNIPTGCV